VKSEAVAAPTKRRYAKSAAQKEKEAAAAKKQNAKAGPSHRTKMYTRKTRPTRRTRTVSEKSEGSQPTRSNDGVKRQTGKRKQASSDSDDSGSESSSLELPRKRVKRRVVKQSMDKLPKGTDAKRAAVEALKVKKSDAAAEKAKVDAQKKQQKLALARAQIEDAERAAAEVAEKAAEAAQAAEMARTPVRASSPRPPPSPVGMMEVFICWNDDVLPLQVPSDSTVEKIGELISDRTGKNEYGKPRLPPERYDLRFGVTNIRSMPNGELLTTLGVQNGARLVLRLLKGNVESRAAPSPGLSPAARNAARKRRLDAANEKVKQLEKERRASMPPPTTAMGSTRWTGEEADCLIEGVRRFGFGEWAAILQSVWARRADFPKRSATDLKDKWRNLVASTTKPVGFKFRVTYVTPALLETVTQVRELAEKKMRFDDAQALAQMRVRREEAKKAKLVLRG